MGDFTYNLPDDLLEVNSEIRYGITLPRGGQGQTEFYNTQENEELYVIMYSRPDKKYSVDFHFEDAIRGVSPDLSPYIPQTLKVDLLSSTRRNDIVRQSSSVRYGDPSVLNITFDATELSPDEDRIHIDALRVSSGIRGVQETILEELRENGGQPSAGTYIKISKIVVTELDKS